MIADFEQRLADALGARIAAPFAGRVDVAPGGDPAGGARLIVGVTSADVVEPDLGSRRSEVVPGSANPRHAVRLSCIVTLEVKPGTASRTDQLHALDAALYALDAAEFRDGTALSGDDDRGFFLQHLEPAGLSAPFEPSPDNGNVALRLNATGLFWPIGVTGQEAKAIGEIRIRSGILPIDILPADPLIVAGGAPVELTIRVRAVAFKELQDKPATLPFDQVAVQLFAPGAKPGNGTLTGGDPGKTELIRILKLQDGSATVNYSPPAKPGLDELVIAFPGVDGALGLEVARATLRIRKS